MSRTKRPQYTDRLPGTPCTPQMREKVVNLAQREGLSIADIQRRAYTIFLSSFVSDAYIMDSKAHKESPDAELMEL